MEEGGVLSSSKHHECANRYRQDKNGYRDKYQIDCIIEPTGYVPYAEPC